MDERHRDHALFMAYAPAEDPKIAIAMVVENAGFGGANAAPIARRAFDYYLQGLYPSELMIAIMVLVMVVGTAMDMTPTILILTPVLMPIVKAAGIDPVYFGVLFIINNSIGLVTPPAGTVLNVVAGVGKISMDDVTRGVVPFMIAEFAVMFLMVLFPWLVTGPARLFHG
jgi:TRAP-type C4-dicarboxylate transport system permease large subunit